jgi:hypothetical protein
MRNFRSFVVLALACIAAATAGAGVPPVPATPAAVEDIVYAAPFVLNEGYTSDWRLERPRVTRGHLVVLKVAPDLVYPRQTAEPVLYAGDQTVERLNIGYPSGYVVGIVPGSAELSRVPMWFGTPALPESVDASAVRSERSRAVAAGIGPLPADRVRAALRERLELRDKLDLLREAGALVQLYAPDETDRAAALAQKGR